MKRLLYAAAMAMALAAFLPAEEREGAKKEGPREMLGWQWANFAILAAGLGYLIAKNVPPFFRSRTEEIQRGISEAAKLKAGAEAKMAEVESRFAALGGEIERLRTQLKSEMAAEGERIQQETQHMLKRIQEQAEQEMSFLSKAARNELRAHAASLALDLAETRLANRMNPQTQQGLVESFVRDLGAAGNGAGQ